MKTGQTQEQESAAGWLIMNRKQVSGNLEKMYLVEVFCSKPWPTNECETNVSTLLCKRHLMLISLSFFESGCCRMGNSLHPK